jgi:branched-subunit amino acid aminotransferase/4-amino-4-deoxychorismate lyase
MRPGFSPLSWSAWRYAEGEFRLFSGELPLVDRGFRYGQHVFESIAIRKGEAFLMGDHLLLLKSSARRLRIPCSRALFEKLRSFPSSVALADGMLRVYLTAGPGAPGSEITAPGCYLTWESTRFPTADEIEAGCSLALIRKAFPGEGWGIKSGNYAAHLEALQLARSAGAEEGIVCDGMGRILSCAMGNLLVWMPASTSRKPPILCTPPSSVAVRAGTVLAWVRRLVPVIERELRPADLQQAIAMAVTNSRLGVMPVAALDGVKLSGFSSALTLAHKYLHDLLGSA